MKQIKYVPFTLPCPPAKAQVQDMHDGITYWQNRALEMWKEMLRDLNNYTADEFWREELETIAEILEADGDEWNCAARIRKMLTTSPSGEEQKAEPERLRLIPLTERMPDPDKHPRVVVYTEGSDFQGEQFFDVDAESLNENLYADPADQPEVCRYATHWIGANDLACLAKAIARTAPAAIQLAKAQIPIGEVIEEMSSDPEFIKGLEDGRRRMREAKAQDTLQRFENETPALPSVNAQFEVVDGDITGTTEAPVKRVEVEDDGSLTVVIDHWPEWSGLSKAQVPEGYAGVTVWVGDRQVTQIVSQTELVSSNADELLRRFENARHLLTASPAPAHIPGAGEMIDDHIGDGNELVSALRQYRHNDDSGFVFAYDKEQTDRIVTGLVEALEQIAESCDVGRYDGKPEDGPMRTDMEMWLIAQEALNTYLQQEETER